MNVDTIAVHPVSVDDPAIKMDTKELVEMIRQLPAGYQTIFNLVAVEGYDHAEVAELLNMNINTVRSQYSRARALLIIILKEYNNMTERKNYAGNL
jgi:RNA polymerase sigma-70 factor (ECF subfamily)